VLVVAIDGHGASGKSTIAAAVAATVGAALVHTDDFFRQPVGGGRVSALAAYYDWERLRAEALEPLRAGRVARFRRFDWAHGDVPVEPVTVEPVTVEPVTVEPAAVILLEGVFSAAPELADLVDAAVLVETPEPVRLRRLRARISPGEWDSAWLDAERAYFRDPENHRSFCLIVFGSTTEGRS
jgi:uridine kinase